MKTNITILFFIIYNFSFACTCGTMDKTTAERIYKLADYVIIGTIIENVHHDEQFKLYLDKNNYGREVKIKVDSVLKGTINSKYVIVNQTDEGNCFRSFKFGKKYLIVGYQIKGYKNIVNTTYNSQNKRPDSVNKIPITKRINSGERRLERFRENFLYINDGLEIATFWNNLAKESPIIKTNICLSNYSNSEFAELFKGIK